MSITPERLDGLALEVAKKFLSRRANTVVMAAGLVPEFARALLAAVEAELKPVAWNYDLEDAAFNLMIAQGFNADTPLVSLPLIKEK